jgi:hypothetical protein
MLYFWRELIKNIIRIFAKLNKESYMTSKQIFNNRADPNNNPHKRFWMTPFLRGFFILGQPLL